VGREHKICPFYHSRSLLKDAELIFVLYNYLFDRDARETTLAEVDFQNAVLIFDEARNLEEFASESSSFDLSSSDVAGCVMEVQRAVQYLEMNPDMGAGAGMKNNMLKLKSLFLGMERYLTHCGGEVVRSEAGQGRGGFPSGRINIRYVLDGLKVNHTNLKLFKDFVKNVIFLLSHSKPSR